MGFSNCIEKAILFAGLFVLTMNQWLLCLCYQSCSIAKTSNRLLWGGKTAFKWGLFGKRESSILLWFTIWAICRGFWKCRYPLPGVPTTYYLKNVIRFTTTTRMSKKRMSKKQKLYIFLSIYKKYKPCKPGNLNICN